MAVTVIFHSLAQREYRAAVHWYARRSARAAQRFEDAVDRAVQQIADDPARWPLFRRHHRWVRAGRYPYVLYYRILGPDQVLIMAVAHTGRRPGYWLRRPWP